MLKVQIKSKFLICLSIIFGLSGCATEEVQQEAISIEEHITFFNTNSESGSSQSLKIVHAYEGMTDYAKAARDAEIKDVPDLYKTHVVNLYEDDCTVDGAFSAIGGSFTKNPTRKYDYLIDGANEIRESDIEQIISEAWKDSLELLPTPETTICVFIIEPDATFVKDNMGGVTGFTIGPGKFWIQIYPGTDWTSHIPYLVAHEYHHSVLFTRHYGDATIDDLNNLDLLDRMIFEGKADSFAEMVYPGTEAPWAHALTEKQMVYQWERIQDELDATDDPTTGRWLFGYRGVTLWTGYALGFNIVQGYLNNHPEAVIDDWTAVEAEELLAKSDFDPKPPE